MDEKLALLWLQKAAEGGHEKAQCELSEAYHLGKFGLDVDQEKAFGLCKKLQKEAAPERRIQLRGSRP